MGEKLTVALDWTPRGSAAHIVAQRWLSRTTNGFTRVRVLGFELYADANGLVELHRDFPGKDQLVLWRGRTLDNGRTYQGGPILPPSAPAIFYPETEHFMPEVSE